MAFPNVLLIGAMKSGTTGLYIDLATHPNVYLAQDKEPGRLCTDRMLTKEGRQEYAELYAGAHKSQLVLDASTNYAKRPDYDGVVSRALNVLPEGFKVIYVVRHPIDRILSQHHHEYSAGLVSGAVDTDIRRHSRYIDYSSYAYQLQPWLEAIGRDRVKVVGFEDYKSRRQEIVADVGEFLGLAPQGFKIKFEKVYNKSDGKPVKTSFWKGVAGNSLYKNFVRRMLPPKLRLAMYQWLLPPAPEKPPGPSQATLEWLRESLADDVHQLSNILGLSEPLWSDFPKAVDPELSRAPYANQKAVHASGT
ncbi:sulfotransferase domain-containing protein [Bythopirellula goksoeyrii]|uniref:Sulfotransferase domain protein n=1 Tax=Bythopirellula goksoeyrii TaxID=1400387 RepID=A0A5B9QSV4_9BACT|nr:sulfotransferase domain-containing protein [Bythopirellula goksoeyrii]QEG36993.1 Sulfotransferase domain protein [Bythopirellula goksoeyrii]